MKCFFNIVINYRFDASIVGFYLTKRLLIFLIKPILLVPIIFISSCVRSPIETVIPDALEAAALESKKI
ncbi:MAG: hypothetical protein ACJAUP_001910 [Cellvibrionaceae bacterium]|jgi:hypothetical protein